jgi:hypothetical protein
MVTEDSGHGQKIGHLRSELAVTFGQNDRSRSNGIRGQDGAECALVEKGLGYTVLPLSVISREREAHRLKFAPLIQPKVTRQLVLGLPDGIASRATKIVIDLARDEIQALTRSGQWRAKLLFPSRHLSRSIDQPIGKPMVGGTSTPLSSVVFRRYAGAGPDDWRRGTQAHPTLDHTHH